jgi:hypothetical protein
MKQEAIRSAARIRYMVWLARSALTLARWCTADDIADLDDPGSPTR